MILFCWTLSIIHLSCLTSVLHIIFDFVLITKHHIFHCLFLTGPCTILKLFLSKIYNLFSSNLATVHVLKHSNVIDENLFNTFNSNVKS